MLFHSAISLEPLDEDSYRVSMRVLAAAGNRSAALTVYETCRAVLAREFKVEPDPETVALRDAIRAGRFALGGPRPTAGVPTENARAYALNNPHADALPAQPLKPAPTSPHAPGKSRPVLVAREPELARLSRFLDQARSGQGRVVFITGEAGAGKSALMEELAQRAIAEIPDLVVARGSCNAFVGIGDPYLPFRDILQTLGGDPEAERGGDAFSPERARRLEAALGDCAEALIERGPDLLGLFVPISPLLARLDARAQAGDDRAARLVEQARRRSLGPAAPTAPAALFEQFAQVLRSIAGRRPLLLLINDLQWADSESISLLFHLGRRLNNSRVLFLCSYRADDVELGRDGGRHPLEGVVNELEREFGELTVSLPATPGRAFVDALLDSEPNDLPEDFRAALTCRTGGHPLFTVEMLRGLQDRGDLLRDAQGRWRPGPRLDWDQLPSRIEAVLAERVGRLPARQRELLEIASVEGEEFTVEIAAVALGLGEDEAARWVGGPLRRLRLVVPTGFHHLGPRRLSRHRFTHYVLRQYLYSRIDPIDRLRLHEAVGRALEAMSGEAAPENAVRLAWHFDQAGLADEAVNYLLRAGQQAMRLSAYHEAIAHFQRGLALLATLPPSPERAARELDLRVPLANALIPTRGWGASERLAAVADAAPRGAQSGAAAQAIFGLVMQSSVLQAKGELAESIRVGEEALALASASGNRQSLMLSYGSLGISHYLLGGWHTAREHLERVLGLYSRAEDGPLLAVIGADPEAIMLSLLAITLWMLGYGDQARAAADRARRVAEELAHPITRATVVSWLLTLYALANLPADFEGDIANLLRVSQERDWPEIQTSAALLEGWWMTRRGQSEAGIGRMQATFASSPVVTGNVGPLSFDRVIFARACLDSGRVEEGLAAVEERLALCRRGIGRLVEPELHQLRGLFLPDEAEACFRQAIACAREQGARAWELRSAISLARHWQQRGRQVEARDLLTGVYSGFSEGFDTPDLREAAGVLEELAREVDAV